MLYNVSILIIVKRKNVKIYNSTLNFFIKSLQLDVVYNKKAWDEFSTKTLIIILKILKISVSINIFATLVIAEN